jgi:hypothetical protein
MDRHRAGVVRLRRLVAGLAVELSAALELFHSWVNGVDGLVELENLLK